MATILAVAVFAVLAGAKTYRQVGDRVADLPQPLLALAGARSCPALGVVQAPSGSTIRRVLIAVDGDAADRVVGSWLASLLDPDRSALLGLAMDGKTVRDAGTADGEVQLSPRWPMGRRSWWGRCGCRWGRRRLPRSARCWMVWTWMVGW